jgi:hypothetical protein
MRDDPSVQRAWVTTLNAALADRVDPSDGTIRYE